MGNKARAKAFLPAILALAFLSGCAFSQRDYELQEEAYQKEQKAKEEAANETFQYRW